MAVSVQMPALGESVTEGTVTRWLKQEGDTVELDEPLLEVSTDKVDTEIPAPVSGTLLSITVNEDETVDVPRVGRGAGQVEEHGGDAHRRMNRNTEPTNSTTPSTVNLIVQRAVLFAQSSSNPSPAIHGLLLQ